MALRRVLFLLALVVPALLVPAVADAHHKPGHYRRATTTTAAPVPATTTTTAGAMPTTTITMGTNRSGLPWRSGVHTGSFPADYTAFETWRQRLVDVTLQYSSRDTWAGIEDPWVLYEAWPGEMIVGQPFWPEGSGGTLAAAAAGTYDAHYAAYGSNLVAAGKGSLLTEVAWEFNGNWFEWSATSAANYIGAFQHFVTAVRSTAPNARFAWTINAHSTNNPPSGVIMDAYPGDAYVNVIGIDTYDQFPPNLTQGTWDSQIAATGGLQWILDIAVAHGKPLMVAEWGVAAPADADHGGDNAFFVTKMQDWFRANATKLYGEMYFDFDPAGIFSADSTIINTNSAAEYKAGLHG
jgi:hypothetical protein